MADQLECHPGFQEAVSGLLIQSKAELFEQNLDLNLHIVTLLVWIVDFPQDLEERKDPRILAVENLKAGLRSFSEDAAHEDDHVFLLLDVALH